MKEPKNLGEIMMDERWGKVQKPKPPHTEEPDLDLNEWVEWYRERVLEIMNEAKKQNDKP